MVYELLKINGADINISNKEGSTPLHIASKNGNLSICHLLIRDRAAIDALDRCGHTPLSIAEKNEHFLICEMLKIESER